MYSLLTVVTNSVLYIWKLVKYFILKVIITRSKNVKKKKKKKIPYPGFSQMSAILQSHA